ncbi:Uma2 family endonuclease [Actinomadura sp. WMMB 499]|uniref:Uma2 family endonuclease n=1 Tax=Actinomadura sp. WMMB 499 TaxID=1219491 RepID=UPI001247FB55|nr:Uma2 family endonuclease [Actinomadura sp. WMMB 499]QFG25096.1 Uma2 family endonuclease [Actinomadura sp. WMMB 499]
MDGSRIVRERPRDVSVTPEVHMSDLPDTPYNLWVRGELDDYVDAPEGSRIEVIEGEVVVSPAPTVAHGTPLRHITRALERAAFDDPDFPWVAQQVAELDLVGLGQIFIPDLVITTEEILHAVSDADLPRLMSDEIEMAVEVTSRNGKGDDLPPPRTDHRKQEKKPNKWTGYARTEIPYYLVVDRSPKMARTTLYSIPDQATAAYLHEESWEFGETIHLPDPFGIDIDTTHWKPWRD